MKIEGLNYNETEKTPKNKDFSEAQNELFKNTNNLRQEMENLAEKNRQNTRSFLDNVDLNLNFGYNGNIQKNINNATTITNYDGVHLSMINEYVANQNRDGEAGTFLHLTGAEEESQKFMFSLFPNDKFLNEKYSKYLENIKVDDYSKVSPLDIILEIAKNSPEDEKIKLAQIVTAYSGVYTYDHSMLKQDMKAPWNSKNIPKEEYWRLLREGGLTGVCRHIHRAGAEILAGLGMEAGVVSVNSGVKHAVTIGRRQNGNYFLIDYGKVYEGKDVERIISDYSAEKGAVDLQTFFSDSNGKFIGRFRTELQKAIAKNTNVIGEMDNLDYSGKILKGNRGIKDGLSIDSDISNGTGRASAYYGFSGKREVGLDGNFSKLSDGTTLKTVGLNYREKTKIFNGDFEGAVKLTGSQIGFNNGKKLNQGGVSVQASYMKNIYEKDDLKVSASASASTLVNFNLDKKRKSPLNDGQSDLGGSLRIDKKFSENLSGYLQGGIGGDVGIENMGGGKISLYGKNYLEGGVKYKNENLLVSASVGQKTSLDGTKIYGKVEAYKDKYLASFEGSYLNRNKNPFLPNESSFSGKLGYNLNNNTTFNFNAGIKKYGNKTSANVGAGVSLNF